MQIFDTSPVIDVAEAEYVRLLGYPRGWTLNGRARELADEARNWYLTHGTPWIWSREAGGVEIVEAGVRIDGTSFTSKRVARTLKESQAHTVVLVAVGAGPEIEAEAQRLWREEKPDEYFFYEMYGSAVVEHLVTAAGARLCAWAEAEGMAVLPHYSPGYPEWGIAEQPDLLRLMKSAGGLPSALEVLESGTLVPKKSLLALFGVTRHTDHLRRLTDLVPCENCSFAPCQYRRAPYARSSRCSEIAAPLSQNAGYAVNRKALKRWAEERLSLQQREDGTVDALFRYEGTTCTNMGRPLAFEYHVKLGPREDGYPIQDQRCEPAPGDTGYQSMCRYVAIGPALMTAIEGEKPLSGRPLNDVLSWRPAQSAAGCYCEPASREHKWALVLETIHYALSQKENE